MCFTIVDIIHSSLCEILQTFIEIASRYSHSDLSHSTLSIHIFLFSYHPFTHSSASNSNISAMDFPALKNSSSVIFPSWLRSHWPKVDLILASISASSRGRPSRRYWARVMLRKMFSQGSTQVSYFYSAIQ